jgi:hypothetical protein
VFPVRYGLPSAHRVYLCFKRGHSTTHALLWNVERITHGFNYNKATVMLFLDIERAFDKVWTTGLIARLIKAKFHLT